MRSSYSLKLVLIPADQNWVRHQNGSIVEGKAALIADGENRPDQVLIEAHASGDAVHDDSGLALPHSHTSTNADVSTESYHIARMGMKGMRTAVSGPARTLNLCNPEQRLADGKVADNLRGFRIGWQLPPERNVLCFPVSDAGKK